MKLDFLSPPPPLPFGSEEDGFSLLMKRIDATDRAAVLDAIQQKSLMSVQAELERHVCGWKNVCDAKGVAVPFEEEDDKGRKTCNLSKFLGGLDLVDQMRVMAGLLIFIGLPAENANSIVESLVKAGESGKLGGAVHPTPPSHGSGKTTVSES